MLRRELNEILETNPKAEGKMTWNECLDYAAKNYAKIREWQSMPQKFISIIHDYDTFMSFKKAWVQTYKDIYTIPIIYKYIADYQSIINEYNQSIIEKTDKGLKLVDTPYTYNQDEFNKLFAVNSMIKDFSEKKYDFISSMEFKGKIFKHTIAMLSSDENIKLMNEGQISDKTLKALPSLIAPFEVYTGMTHTKKEADDIKEKASLKYHENLSELYKNIGLELPEATEMTTKLKGVTFDGRQENLKQLYTDFTDCTKIPIMAERKYFNGEPCVQIYAIPDNEKIDLGFIDKTLASDIEMNYNNARVDAKFDKLECVTNNKKTTYYGTISLVVSPEAQKIIEKDEDKEHVLETE